MRTKVLIILTLTVFAAFTSCKKAPLTVGKTITETRALADFSEVRLNDNISLSLMRSDTNYIVITTGENILENITTEIDGDVLTISNTTTLNWIRPYDYEIHATLYYKDISNFIFNSSGTLDTKNSYNDPDHEGFYRFEVDGGCGDIDILVNNCPDFRFVYQYGTSHVTLHGENNNHFVVYKRSYGIFDARNYQAQHVDIQNVSVADCFIWATDIINAEITHHGNIYYKGEPAEISCNYGPFAEGKLLPL